MAPITQLTISVKNTTEYSFQVDDNPKSFAVVDGTENITAPVDAAPQTSVTAGVFTSTGNEGDSAQGVVAYFAPLHSSCAAIWFRVLSDQSAPNIAKVAAFNPTKLVDLDLINSFKDHEVNFPAEFPFTDPVTGEEIFLVATVRITPGVISFATVTITKKA